MALSFDNFDFQFYIYMNDNLNLENISNKKEAYEDYKKNINNRIVRINEKIFENFDSLIYLLCNKDLKRLNIKNLKYAKYHYFKFGRFENRISELEHVKKILKNFNWIEYIYLNKHLLHNFNSNRECIIHYLLHGINFNRKYKCEKKIALDFDWIIYTNYYHDLNFINNYRKAFEHYIKVGIDEERIDWINLRNILYDLNEEEYLKNDKSIKNLSKKKIIHDWIKNDKNGKILTIKKKNILFNEEFGIAISVYSDKNTPKERLLASFKCLNYIFLLIQNCNIYIIIDGNINEKHFEFLKKLKNTYKNCFLYKNIENYGISITKNICLKILNSNEKLKYFCLLDDDIFIKNNFIDYSIDILNKYDIPILTNFNKGLPYFNNNINKCFINSNFYLGNILIFSKKYFRKWGYFRVFPYKWGEEHQEFTNRYFKDSIYKNFTVDFRKYINDEFVINNISTLHLHTINIEQEKVKINKKKYFEFIKLNEYVDFNLNKYNFIKI